MGIVRGDQLVLRRAALGSVDWKGWIRGASEGNRSGGCFRAVFARRVRGKRRGSGVSRLYPRGLHREGQAQGVRGYPRGYTPRASLCVRGGYRVFLGRRRRVFACAAVRERSGADGRRAKVFAPLLRRRLRRR